jgi:hypothetical protein
LVIALNDFRKDCDFLDKGQIESLFRIMSNTESEYDSVTLCVDTDHNPKGELLGKENPIVQFLLKLCEITDDMKMPIESKEIKLYRVNA